MKKSKLLLVISVIVALLCSNLSLASSAKGGNGMEFEQSFRYETEQPLDRLPLTMEAMLKFSKDFNHATLGGVIYGNYSIFQNTISFEILSNGCPRYLIIDAGKVYDCIFNEVNVCTGEWEHLAVVNDPKQGKIYCYVNGMLEQTVQMQTCEDSMVVDQMVLGGNRTQNNDGVFRGALRSVAVYGTTRTAQQIKSDFDGKIDQDGLMAYYDVSDVASKTEKIEDLSRYKRHLYFRDIAKQFFSEKQPLEEYEYSFAVVGDQQNMCLLYPDTMDRMYDWIVENQEKKKIKFVFGLGDMTERNTDEEWMLAQKNVQKLDGILPYSMVRGNHDSSANFQKYFPYETYGKRVSGVYARSMLNTWQELVVGETKYLMMTLDYGPSAVVLNWASKIIESHPEHNVIITTHAYLDRDAKVLQEDASLKAGGGILTGAVIWEKLIKKYPNIVLVMSGHILTEKIVLSQIIGDHGNTVTQMLINPQQSDLVYGGLGMVALLYFSKDGRKVQVEYYSTARKKYFMQANQFSVQLTKAGDFSLPEKEDSVWNPTLSSNASISSQLSSKKKPLDLFLGLFAAGAVAIVGVGTAVLLYKRKKRKN